MCQTHSGTHVFGGADGVDVGDAEGGEPRGDEEPSNAARSRPRARRWFVFAGVLFSACAPASGPRATEPVVEARTEVEAPLVAPILDPLPLAASVPIAFVGDPATSLGPADIVLQLDHSPSSVPVSLVDPTRSFGHVPAVTLYRDGTVVADVDGGVRWWSLGPQAADDEVRQVLALGFDRLRSSDARCRRTAKGPLCTSDDATVVLRVRLADGSLAEHRSYAGIVPRHQAILDAILQRVEALGTPPLETARSYVAAGASVFLRVADDLEPDTIARADSWPLDDTNFDRTMRERWIVIAIDRDDVLRLTPALGHTDDVVLRRGARALRAAMVPWLPGEDHRSAIATTVLGR